MEVGSAPEILICDLDYEKNSDFFHCFLKIRGIVKKLAIFTLFFSPSSPVQFSLLDAVSRQESR